MSPEICLTKYGKKKKMILKAWNLLDKVWEAKENDTLVLLVQVCQGNMKGKMILKSCISSMAKKCEGEFMTKICERKENDS